MLVRHEINAQQAHAGMDASENAIIEVIERNCHAAHVRALMGQESRF